MKKAFTVILILCLVSLILEYKLGISDFRFTSILQKILNVINPAKNAHLKTVFSKSCNKSFTIDSRFILKEQWQPIENVSDTHNVYSAYYHRAGSSPIIKIIGNFNRYYKPISLYCQLWYINQAGATVGSMVHTNASVYKLREGQGSRHSVSFFHCPLSNRKRPSAVSLTSTPCSHPNNLLPVQSHVTNGTYERNFTVCAAPFHKAYNDTKNIVQWIELNRILGAEHFVFYNYSATVFIDRVLEFYREKGLVTVVQWNVSRFLNETVMHYYGQHAAMNDCLMRVKNITQFVVNCDLDEYLVPHSNISTWHQIVELHPKFGGYLFLNSFSWLNWTNTQKEFSKKQSALKHNLYTILKLQREPKIYRATDRSKYFCRSNVTESMGTHEIFSMTRGWRTYNLAPNEGLLHHYRILLRDASTMVKEITDMSLFEKYRERLIETVLEIHDAMKSETE